MTVLLVIDIGNTNVALGIFDYASGGLVSGGPVAGTPIPKLAHHWRIGTHREQTSDEVGLTVRALLKQTNRTCSTEVGSLRHSPTVSTAILAARSMGNR